METETNNDAAEFARTTRELVQAYESRVNELKRYIRELKRKHQLEIALLRRQMRALRARIPGRRSRTRGGRRTL